MENEELTNFFITEHQLRLSKGTLAIYRKRLSLFEEYISKSFLEVNTKNIREWVNELKRRNYQAATINIHIACLKKFYDFCNEEELIQNNPAKSIELLKIEEKPPYYLSYEQLNELRRLTEPNLYKRLIVELLYCTGIRIGELIAIEKIHINIEDRCIYIPKGKRKRERLVFFTNNCLEYLQDFLKSESDSPYLFSGRKAGRPKTIRSMQYYFEEFSEELDFEITPHTMRHTFAAHLAIKGMPLEAIQHLLGHETVEQTRYYAELYHDVRKEQYNYWID